jgi:hypothetical protein
MFDLATLTAEEFTPVLNGLFRISEGDRSYDLELVQITHLQTRQPGQQRQPFALTFRSRPGLRAQQHIYRLENERFGSLEVFLTQLSADSTGSTFEAVFN